MDGICLQVACSLTDSEFQERRRDVLQKVRSAVIEMKELVDGFADQLPSGGEWIDEVANLINLERQCCPFLRLSLIVEPGDGHLWLELTGPEGTKGFLMAAFE